MFFHVSAFIATSFAILAVASPVDLEVRGNSCSSGGTYCCSSYQSVSNYQTSQLLGWLGIPIPTGSNTLVGFTCSPITVGGTGTGANCVSQQACCDNTYFNGGVNVGCSPISVIG
ncbi:fungal hydrophobin-domain-containing protein [Scleroderma yunnanense]